MYIGGRPEPTSIEFDTAISNLVTAMEKSAVIQQVLLAKDIKYGLIGDTAVMLYARYLKLPYLQAKNIEMVIQPNDKISVEEVITALSTEKVFKELGFRKHARSKVLQIHIKRQKMEIPIDVTIVDHYVWPEYRKHYDLDLTKNNRANYQLNSKKVPLLNASWILRQQIREWNKCDDYEIKKETITKIKTMCDVVGLRKKKLIMRSKADIKELRNLKDHFEDDVAILSSVIDCPEVLGSWYNLRWVQYLLFFILILASLLTCDYFASCGAEDPTRVHRIRTTESTSTRTRSQTSPVTPVFSRLQDAELHASLEALKVFYEEELHKALLEQGRLNLELSRTANMEHEEADNSGYTWEGDD